MPLSECSRCAGTIKTGAYILNGVTTHRYAYPGVYWPPDHDLSSCERPVCHPVTKPYYCLTEDGGVYVVNPDGVVFFLDPGSNSMLQIYPLNTYVTAELVPPPIENLAECKPPTTDTITICWDNPNRGNNKAQIIRPRHGHLVPWRPGKIQCNPPRLAPPNSSSDGAETLIIPRNNFWQNPKRPYIMEMPFTNGYYVLQDGQDHCVVFYRGTLIYEGKANTSGIPVTFAHGVKYCPYPGCCTAWGFLGWSCEKFQKWLEKTVDDKFQFIVQSLWDKAISDMQINEEGEITYGNVVHTNVNDTQKPEPHEIRLTVLPIFVYDFPISPLEDDLMPVPDPRICRVFEVGSVDWTEAEKKAKEKQEAAEQAELSFRDVQELFIAASQKVADTEDRIAFLENFIQESEEKLANPIDGQDYGETETLLANAKNEKGELEGKLPSLESERDGLENDLIVMLPDYEAAMVASEQWNKALNDLQRSGELLGLVKVATATGVITGVFNETDMDALVTPAESELMATSKTLLLKNKAYKANERKITALGRRIAQLEADLYDLSLEKSIWDTWLLNNTNTDPRYPMVVAWLQIVNSRISSRNTEHTSCVSNLDSAKTQRDIFIQELQDGWSDIFELRTKLAYLRAVKEAIDDTKLETLIDDRVLWSFRDDAYWAKPLPEEKLGSILFGCDYEFQYHLSEVEYHDNCEDKVPTYPRHKTWYEGSSGNILPNDVRVTFSKWMEQCCLVCFEDSSGECSELNCGGGCGCDPPSGCSDCYQINGGKPGTDKEPEEDRKDKEPTWSHRPRGSCDPDLADRILRVHPTFCDEYDPVYQDGWIVMPGIGYRLPTFDAYFIACKQDDEGRPATIKRTVQCHGEGCVAKLEPLGGRIFPIRSDSGYATNYAYIVRDMANCRTKKDYTVIGRIDVVNLNGLYRQLPGMVRPDNDNVSDSQLGFNAVHALVLRAPHTVERDNATGFTEQWARDDDPVELRKYFTLFYPAYLTRPGFEIPNDVDIHQRMHRYERGSAPSPPQTELEEDTTKFNTYPIPSPPSESLPDENGTTWKFGRFEKKGLFWYAHWFTAPIKVKDLRARLIARDVQKELDNPTGHFEDETEILQYWTDYWTDYFKSRGRGDDDEIPDWDENDKPKTLERKMPVPPQDAHVRETDSTSGVIGKWYVQGPIYRKDDIFDPPDPPRMVTEQILVGEDLITVTHPPKDDQESGIWWRQWIQCWGDPEGLPLRVGTQEGDVYYMRYSIQASSPTQDPINIDEYCFWTGFHWENGRRPFSEIGGKTNSELAIFYKNMGQMDLRPTTEYQASTGDWETCAQAKALFVGKVASMTACGDMLAVNLDADGTHRKVLYKNADILWSLEAGSRAFIAPNGEQMREGMRCLGDTYAVATYSIGDNVQMFRLWMLDFSESLESTVNTGRTVLKEFSQSFDYDKVPDIFSLRSSWVSRADIEKYGNAIMKNYLLVQSRDGTTLYAFYKGRLVKTYADGSTSCNCICGPRYALVYRPGEGRPNPCGGTGDTSVDVWLDGRVAHEAISAQVLLGGAIVVTCMFAKTVNCEEHVRGCSTSITIRKAVFTDAGDSKTWVSLLRVCMGDYYMESDALSTGLFPLSEIGDWSLFIVGDSGDVTEPGGVIGASFTLYKWNSKTERMVPTGCSVDMSITGQHVWSTCPRSMLGDMPGGIYAWGESRWSMGGGGSSRGISMGWGGCAALSTDPETKHTRQAQIMGSYYDYSQTTTGGFNSYIVQYNSAVAAWASDDPEDIGELDGKVQCMGFEGGSSCGVSSGWETGDTSAVIWCCQIPPNMAGISTFGNTMLAVDTDGHVVPNKIVHYRGELSWVCACRSSARCGNYTQITDVDTKNITTYYGNTLLNETTPFASCCGDGVLGDGEYALFESGNFYYKSKKLDGDFRNYTVTGCCGNGVILRGTSVHFIEGKPTLVPDGDQVLFINGTRNINVSGEAPISNGTLPTTDKLSLGEDNFSISCCGRDYYVVQRGSFYRKRPDIEITTEIRQCPRDVEPCADTSGMFFYYYQDCPLGQKVKLVSVDENGVELEYEAELVEIAVYEGQTEPNKTGPTGGQEPQYFYIFERPKRWKTKIKDLRGDEVDVYFEHDLAYSFDTNNEGYVRHGFLQEERVGYVPWKYKYMGETPDERAAYVFYSTEERVVANEPPKLLSTDPRISNIVCFRYENKGTIAAPVFHGIAAYSMFYDDPWNNERDDHMDWKDMGVGQSVVTWSRKQPVVKNLLPLYERYDCFGGKGPDDMNIWDYPCDCELRAKIKQSYPNVCIIVWNRELHDSLKIHKDDVPYIPFHKIGERKEVSEADAITHPLRDRCIYVNDYNTAVRYDRLTANDPVDCWQNTFYSEAAGTGDFWLAAPMYNGEMSVANDPLDKSGRLVVSGNNTIYVWDRSFNRLEFSALTKERLQ